MTRTQQYSTTSVSSSIHQGQKDKQSEHEIVAPASIISPPILDIGLLTAGRDPPYALGLAAALAAAGVSFDLIGSDDLDGPELRGNLRIRFLNLRGDQRA